MIFFHAILPLFVLMATGYLLGRFRGTSAAPLSDVCLYILIPILIFGSLVQNPMTGGEFARIFAWFFGLVVFYILAVGTVGRLLGWPPATRSAVTLSLASLNAGSYGLPVVLFAFGDEALAPATVLLVCSNINASSLGVYIAAGGGTSPLKALVSIFRLPLIYAVVLALAVNLLGLPIPDRVLSLATLIGKAGPQVALIVLGIQISSMGFRGLRSKGVLGITAAKLLVGPALGIGLALLLGADGLLRNVLFVYACMPTAINFLLLSVRFNARPDFVGGVILGSTLLSPITVTAVLLWVGA